MPAHQILHAHINTVNTLSQKLKWAGSPKALKGLDQTAIPDCYSTCSRTYVTLVDATHIVAAARIGAHPLDCHQGGECRKTDGHEGHRDFCTTCVSSYYELSVARLHMHVQLWSWFFNVSSVTSLSLQQQQDVVYILRKVIVDRHPSLNMTTCRCLQKHIWTKRGCPWLHTAMYCDSRLPGEPGWWLQTTTQSYKQP